jgi:hypothetical protein
MFTSRYSLFGGLPVSPEPDPEFYTAKQLAKRWHCHVKTVHRKKVQGLIPQPCGFRGRIELFRASEIHAFENLTPAERAAHYPPRVQHTDVLPSIRDYLP